MRSTAAMALVAALAAAASAGCGLGPGPASEGEATLTVTRDYGTQRLATAAESDPPESETVMRFLDRNADITTRYGAAFVQSIDGLAGTASNRRRDWFFYVNGVESPVGATEARVHGGDRVWWDYRDWSAAMRVPAVVGSYPQPFAAARRPVSVDCRGAKAPCEEVARRLRVAGADARIGRRASTSVPTVLVGPWAALRRDPGARQVESGPRQSGVFADVAGGRLLALDQSGAVARRLSAGAGLLAAVRDGDAQPSWLVTGSTEAGVDAAAGLLDERVLGDKYAVEVDGGPVIRLPVR